MSTLISLFKKAAMRVADSIPIRRLDFEFSDAMDLVFIEDDPALSYLFVGSWMMLPHLEPFLIRTVQAALEQIRNDRLREEAVRFCAQEGQHFRQHQKMNDVVKRIHPAGPRLAELEREVAAMFEDWSANRPLKFCLAYGEGFESMTCAAARAQMEIGMFDYMKEPIRGLMYWHIMEEVEHRTVAHDVYHACGGNYFHRMKLAMFFQRHYLGLCQRFQAAMLEAAPDVVARYRRPELEAKRKARLAAYTKAFTPKLLATYMPWYSPGAVPLPESYEGARKTYSDLAVSVR
jgi:predicted metal-dependent hydrolase